MILVYCELYFNLLVLYLLFEKIKGQLDHYQVKTKSNRQIVQKQYYVTLAELQFYLEGEKATFMNSSTDCNLPPTPFIHREESTEF